MASFRFSVARSICNRCAVFPTREAAEAQVPALFARFEQELTDTFGGCTRALEFPSEPIIVTLRGAQQTIRPESGGFVAEVFAERVWCSTESIADRVVVTLTEADVAAGRLAPDANLLPGDRVLLAIDNATTSVTCGQFCEPVAFTTFLRTGASDAFQGLPTATLDTPTPAQSFRSSTAGTHFFALDLPLNATRLELFLQVDRWSFSPVFGSEFSDAQWVRPVTDDPDDAFVSNFGRNFMVELAR